MAVVRRIFVHRPCGDLSRRGDRLSAPHYLVGSFLEFAPRQGPARYVGLEHYRRLVGDGIFWLSMWNTLLYTIGSVIFHALVGGFLALLLNEPFAPSRVRNVARGLFILPGSFPWQRRR